MRGGKKGGRDTIETKKAMQTISKKKKKRDKEGHTQTTAESKESKSGIKMALVSGKNTLRQLWLTNMGSRGEESADVRWHDVG